MLYLNSIRVSIHFRICAFDIIHFMLICPHWSSKLGLVFYSGNALITPSIPLLLFPTNVAGALEKGPFWPLESLWTSPFSRKQNPRKAISSQLVHRSPLEISRPIVIDCPWDSFMPKQLGFIPPTSWWSIPCHSLPPICLEHPSDAFNSGYNSPEVVYLALHIQWLFILRSFCCRIILRTLSFP